MNFPATPTDLFNFPSNFKGDTQIFNPGTIPGNLLNFQRWIKPKGTTMTYFFLVGAGGGGGGGHQKPQANAGGGGGGGGSGAITRLLIPSFLLPDILYVLVGSGGTGGAVSAAGISGPGSFVTYSPVYDGFGGFGILISANGGNNGGAGSNTAAGSAGVGGGSTTLFALGLTGLHSSTPGQAGGAGGVQTGAVGTSITAWSTLPLSGGAGGAGIGAGASLFNFAGGNITSAAAINFPKINFPTDVGAVARGGADLGSVVNGDPGVNFLDGPFLQSGGAGGASSFSNVAGNGGKGGIGCGGGGGGSGVTGGRGGDGGNGMVAIFSW